MNRLFLFQLSGNLCELLQLFRRFVFVLEEIGFHALRKALCLILDDEFMRQRHFVHDPLGPLECVEERPRF